MNLDSDSHQHEAVRKRNFEHERESKALPKVLQLASSAPRGHAMHENALFQSIRQTVSFPPSSRVTEICSALRVAYPAGDGSAAILRSKLPKSRRVRWLSRPYLAAYFSQLKDQVTRVSVFEAFYLDNHKKRACGGDVPASPAPERAHISSHAA